MENLQKLRFICPSIHVVDSTECYLGHARIVLSISYQKRTGVPRSITIHVMQLFNDLSASNCLLDLA